MNTAPTRRRFLQGAGVALALPLLDRFAPVGRPALFDGDPSKPPGRMVCLCATLGLHRPYFNPEKAGRDYELTPYLEPLARHREDFTVVSGLSHPGGGTAGTAARCRSSPPPRTPRRAASRTGFRSTSSPWNACCRTPGSRT